MQRTLTIIKPDSVAAGNAGKILAHLENAGFEILAIRRMHLSRAEAKAFYAVHAKRPFYKDLVSFMTSGPIFSVALQRENAVSSLRQTMGATDPAAAEPGSIRALYGSSIERNAIHGSDSLANAELELGFFFSTTELIAA
jgi:nucleoside-diphosphate kinase